MTRDRAGYRNLCQLITKGRRALGQGRIESQLARSVRARARPFRPVGRHRQRDLRRIGSRCHCRRSPRRLWRIFICPGHSASPGRGCAARGSPTPAGRKIRPVDRGCRRSALSQQGAPATSGRAHLFAPSRDIDNGRPGHQSQRRARYQISAGLQHVVRGRLGRRGANSRDRRRMYLFTRRAALSLSLGAAARRQDLVGAFARFDLCRRQLALRRGGSPRHGRSARQGAGPHRRARLLRLFPDHVRDRQVLPQREHPMPGTRLGGQLGGLLLPRYHRHRPGAHGAAFRALHLARAAPSRPTSISTSSTIAAKKSFSTSTRNTAARTQRWSR